MKVELMRYRNDSLSFYMNILAIAFNVVFLIAIMANLSITANAILGVDVLVNILFMLFAFLTAEKVKAYLPKWCYLSIVLSVVQIVRIFTIVIPFANKGELTGAAFVIALLSLIFSIACLVVGFVASNIRSKKLNAYLAGLEAGTAHDTIVDGDVMPLDEGADLGRQPDEKAEAIKSVAEAEEEVMLSTDDVENG